MALKATIVKAHVNLADMDDNRYFDFHTTMAQHPSETPQRLLIRLLAYTLNYTESLTFTKGLCEEDEPEIWQKSLTDDIELWIDLGLPDEKRIKKACQKAKQVIIYSYGEGSQTQWWEKVKNKVAQFKNLQVISLDAQQTQALSELYQRSLQWQITQSDGEIWVNDGNHNITLTPERKM